MGLDDNYETNRNAPPRMATLKDIAQRVGISVSATSMALRDHESIGQETKRKVREAALALGYRVKTKPTGSIAFLLFDRGFDMHVYARFFQGIGEMAAARDLHPVYLALSAAEVEGGKIPSLLRRRGVDGIIVSGVYTKKAHEVLQSLGIPIVVLGNYQLGSAPWAACEVDLSGGARVVIENLHRLGHRRVGVLLSSTDTEYAQRLRTTLKQAIAEYAMETTLFLAGEDVKNPDGTSYMADSLNRFFAESPCLPTALIVEKAHVSIYEVCQNHNLRVPEDLSVISLGRTDYVMHPALATVESDPGEMGRGAFEKLLRLIHHPNTPLTREIFGMHLNPGESITSPRPE